MWASCTTDANCGTSPPTGACVATIVPDDFDQVAEEVEAIEAFLGTNGKNLIIHANVPYCALVENLAATDDDVMFVAFPVANQVELVSCHCNGTCTSPATIQFADDDAALISTAITCSSGTGDMSWTDISGDADGALDAGQRLMRSTDNTPNPDATDDYLICATFSKQ